MLLIVMQQLCGSTDEREVKVSKDVLLLSGEGAGRSWQGEDRLEASEFLVEVTDVLVRSDDRQEGRFQLLGQESVPVHSLLTEGAQGSTERSHTQ